MRDEMRSTWVLRERIDEANEANARFDGSASFAVDFDALRRSTAVNLDLEWKEEEEKKEFTIGVVAICVRWSTSLGDIATSEITNN